MHVVVEVVYMQSGTAAVCEKTLLGRRLMTKDLSDAAMGDVRASQPNLLCKSASHITRERKMAGRTRVPFRLTHHGPTLTLLVLAAGLWSLSVEVTPVTVRIGGQFDNNSCFGGTLKFLPVW